MNGFYVVIWLVCGLIFIPILPFLIFPLLPQIVGFISYRLLKKHNDLVAHFLGIIIPPVSAFYLFKRLSHVEFDSPGNGISILFLVSFIYLFFSLLIQLAIHNRHKLEASGTA